MDLLKDKKKLPIVIGLAVFVLLGAGGLIAFELGAFNKAPAPAPLASTPMTPGLASPGAPRPGMPPMPLGGPPRPGMPPMPLGGPPVRMAMARPGMPARPGTPATPAAPAAPVLVNPAYGPDPFNIPGGTKRILAATPLVVKAPLRSVLPVYNLFQIHPPAPPPTPPRPDVPNGNGGQGQFPEIVIQGIVKSGEGIYAIAAINGQSQTVKPGDSLLDGSRIDSIQDTSVTIRSATGGTRTISISNGGAPGDQGNGQPGDQGNGQPGSFQPGAFGNSPPSFNQ